MIKLKTTLAAIAMAVFATTASAQTVFKVGSTPTSVPFAFIDVKTNSPQGMMIDVIEAVSKEVGFKIEYQPMPFSALIPALTSGKIDIIAAAITATPERAKVVDFTQDVYSYGDGLVVPAADQTQYGSVADLKGKVVGAQIGTRYIEYLKAQSGAAEVKAYEALPDVLREVANGRLAAGIGDFPIFAYNLQQGQFPQLRLVRDYKSGLNGGINLAVKKDNAELLAKINASLTAMKQDGRLKAILEKWNL
ncbi:polar amino acid transport system substrate-binding protein [Azospirillum lipoferum]|nr:MULTISPECIES: ABC transporter substrate-binding protein [Azospirillum]MCP1611992.1 polar amino acid transport system substrate-binding protein [Azospirillum lipoferum]MDW5533249.1 ABC transporter substrate-binding protein [Azospirillum sp. NL1]